MCSTRKLKVAVLMGGRSSEHDVSLNTGSVVLSALDPFKYQVEPIVIRRDGQWLAVRGTEVLRELSLETLQALGPDSVGVVPYPGPPALKHNPDPVDVAFIAMHGPFGEDGTIQGLLEVLDLPYTGSGVLASALAMDKVRAKRLLASSGLQIPKDLVVSAKTVREAPGDLLQEVSRVIGFPCVVKPVAQGSSMGTCVCRSAEELLPGLVEALAFEPQAMVEEYIEGLELTCGILEDPGNCEPVPLPVIEIDPIGHDFFDFEAKYTPGVTEEICPARIPDPLRDRVQKAAVVAHQSLGCRGFSRTDFILRGEELFTLELNTIPGMTPTSLLPKAAKAAGIRFPEMLDRILQVALKVHEEKQIFELASERQP